MSTHTRNRSHASAWYQDANGNTVTSDGSSVVVALSSNSFFSGTTTKSASSGVATFNNLVINTAGTYTLHATDGSLTAADSTSFTIGFGTATKVAFTTQPVSTGAGSTLTSVVVKVQDSLGNTITNDSGTNITLALSGGASFASAAPTYTNVIASSGVVTFGSLQINTTGTYTMPTTNSSGLSEATSTSFTISVGSASKLAFTTQPDNTNQNVTMPNVVVTIQDSVGNTITTDSSTNITVVLSSNAFSAGTATRQAASGLSTFNDLKVAVAGVYTMSTTNTGGLTNATSTEFTIGAVNHLTFTAQPVDTSKGATMANVVVTVQDPSDVTVTGDSATMITVVLSSSSFASGTATRTASSGVATFNDLVINTVGSYTLTTTNTGGLANAATSNIFAVAAPHLVFTSQPVDTTAGATMANVVVTIADLSNATLSSDNSTQITLVVSGGGSFASGTNPRTAVSGVATFNNLVINSATYTFTTTTNNASMTNAVPSDAFTIFVPHLTFTTQPVGTTAGATMSGVVVTVQDLVGATVTTDNTTQITLAVSGGTPFSSGTNPRTVIAGVATFNDLVISTPGSYTLSTTNTGSRTNATSGIFAITSSGAVKLAFTNLALTFAQNVMSATFTIQQQDSVNAATSMVGLLPIKLTSTSSTGAFYQIDGLTLITAGCTAIQATASQVQFRYKDTAPGNITLTAADNATVTTCAGADGALTNATQIETVQSAPKAVTISGFNLLPNPADKLVPPTVQWGASTISVTCKVPDPLVLTNCISKWADKSVTVAPPPGDPGTSVTVFVNGGAASTTVDDHFYYGPVVTSLKPQGGPATGITSNVLVTINGVGFGSSKTVAPVVQWGAAQTITQWCVDPVTKLPKSPLNNCVKSLGDGKITVIAPDSATITADSTTSGGTKIVAVTVNGGASSIAIDNTFYYSSVVTGLKPQAGPAAATTMKVTISGSGFLTNPADKTVPPIVNWGAGNAHDISQLCSDVVLTDCISKWDDKSVAVIAPNATTAGAAVTKQVAVTVNGGTRANSIDNNYYYKSVVTGLKPQ
ncbi:MAG: hypothetical protein EXR58_00725 [Chloroflexi bacterium]|nr:hypothetical protein [Chloroflexota bacterium]